MSLCHNLYGELSHNLSSELLNCEEHEVKGKEENRCCHHS